jgi:porin
LQGDAKGWNSAIALRTLGSLALLAMVGSRGARLPRLSRESKWMTGDWGGTRTELLEKGYDFTLDYVGEVAGNLHGGYNHDKTARYSDQFALGAHLDLQKILGWHDTEFKLASPNAAAQPVQRPHQRPTRWAVQLGAGSLGPRPDLAADADVDQAEVLRRCAGCEIRPLRRRRGLQQLPLRLPEPGVLRLAGGQLGRRHLVQLAGQPVALRVKYNITPEFFAQVGALRAEPVQPGTGNGFKLSGSGTKGAMMPVELVWSPKVNGLPGEYRGLLLQHRQGRRCV